MQKKFIKELIECKNLRKRFNNRRNFYLHLSRPGKVKIRIKNRQKFFEMLLKSFLFDVEFKIQWKFEFFKKPENQGNGQKPGKVLLLQL